jgi:mono/diheme cytochrome c family protein
MYKLWGAIIAILVLAAIVPLGLIALARARPSTAPPVHLILDMVRQPKFKAQRPSAMFADGRAMRPLVPGAEAQSDMAEGDSPDFRKGTVPFSPGENWDSPGAKMGLSPAVPRNQADYDRLVLGIEPQAGGKQGFVTQLPVPVSMELMRRGRERFNIYCAPCHGLAGYGDGMVARRAAEMQAAGANTASGWVAPTNYHTDEIRGRPLGHLYNTISNGIRTMPAYDKQIPVPDRWAIVAYVKALQRSQHAKPEDVPETERQNYEK